jgi:hypothetical protein
MNEIVGVLGQVPGVPGNFIMSIFRFVGATVMYC